MLLLKNFKRCVLKTVTWELVAWAPHTFNKAIKLKTSLICGFFVPKQT